MFVVDDCELIPSYSLGLSSPSISVKPPIVNTSLIGGGAALQFSYAAIKSELHVILLNELR